MLHRGGALAVRVGIVRWWRGRQKQGAQKRGEIVGRRDPNNVWALVRPWLRANDGGKVLQAEERPWLTDPGRNIVLNTNIACHKQISY